MLFGSLTCCARSVSQSGFKMNEALIKLQAAQRRLSRPRSAFVEFEQV